MAYENIQIDDGNFAIGMQAGTFCTLDLSDQALKVKNQTGAQVGPLYTVSSGTISNLLSLDYVGPKDHSGAVDGATFFTLERVSATQCKIKRWELNTTGVSLDLKDTITKTTAGTNYYDAAGQAVEYYRRTFDDHNPGGIDYLDINSVSRISSGTKLFLGPSSDLDNLGATEYVTVDTISGTRAYLTSNVTNQYVDGDDISFYKNIYLVSKIGYAGDTSKGTMFKIDPETGSNLETDNKGFYQGISACKWSTYVQAVACVSSTNLLFVRPYDAYQNWKSMFLNNLEDDDATPFDVYDVEFDDYEVYKLMRKVTLRDDNGDKSTTSWAQYNYRQDTLLPYVNSIDLYTNKAKMIGDADVTNLEIQVRDQFGVGLLNVQADVDIASGDGGVVLSPIDGVVTTDANGYATVGYTSGNTYEGMTEITVNSTGGFTGHGSQYVWNGLRISSDIDFDIDTKLFQRGNQSSEAYIVKQIEQEVSILYYIFCSTFFTTPGGNWLNPSPYAGDVSTYLPSLGVGPGDGPAASLTRGWDPGEADPPSFETRITQLQEFESWNRFRQIDNEFDGFLQWIKQIGEEGPTASGTLLGESELQIDQLKLSHHTYWAGGIAYDYLWTQVSTNQFVFVEDAIPKFYSEKNSIDTTIWIRLRPFAYDLDAAELKFYVKESFYEGITGYRDWTAYCNATAFDAGGGIFGLDVLCTPPASFHHNAVVYVHIEIYDKAPSPNYIYTDYWFKTIPDYRFPYITNLNPDRDQTNVSVSSNVYFEIKDSGVGVDIDSLELLVNSRLVSPSIEKVTDNHYKVTYDPTTDFYYDKAITVSVKVSDSSENENTLIDSYRFYTAESYEIEIIALDPKVCRRGLPRFSDVSLLVLGQGSGVDLSSLRVQIHQQDVSDKVKILPVIYRVS
jgi:hypothetical protein